jgi:hypothetical protein
MKQVDRERDSSITSSCREGSSSSSSSHSISEDEDEDERQPGFSFPVTPSFLRGEAAQRACPFEEPFRLVHWRSFARVLHPGLEPGL